MKIIIGILIGATLIVCLGTIQKENQQICLIYKNPYGILTEEQMQKDINKYFQQGFRVSSLSTRGDNGYHYGILVMEK